MVSAVRVFLEPAVQDVGIHPLAASQSSYGSAGLLAGGNQLGFEFGCVGSVVHRAKLPGISISLSMVCTFVCVHTILQDR